VPGLLSLGKHLDDFIKRCRRAGYDEVMSRGV